MRLELTELEFPITVESFSVDGAESFVRKAVEPFFKLIHPTLKELEQLKNKHAELDAELGKCKPDERWMSEKDLAQADIDEHAEIIHQREKIERKQRAISELIERTTSAIRVKEEQLNDLRKSFADALTTAINTYSNVGRKTIAMALQDLLATDKDYYANTVDLCDQLIAEAGATPADVYEYTGGTHPAATRIFIPSAVTRAKVKNFIEEALSA